MAEYSREVLRIVVAQICQTIGWHSVNSIPLDFLVDLMQEYLLRISRVAHQYAEILGRTEINLDDVGLTFQSMNISIQKLVEYVKNVDSVPCIISVPKLPINRSSNLNFLKPGSREVVTRPVHIHEHLPAMYPENEENAVLENNDSPMNEISNVDVNNPVVNGNQNEPVEMNGTSTEAVFKRPGDPLLPDLVAKRSKLSDESQPLREIHSVMMTTSGFISPAREGKLPEARTPIQHCSDAPPPQNHYPMVPPELKHEPKKIKRVKNGCDNRKIDKENKKKNREKDLFKPDKISEPKVRKTTAKDSNKLKSKSGKSLAPPVPSSSFSPLINPTGINPTYVKDEITITKVPKNSSMNQNSEKMNNFSPSMDIKDNNEVVKLPVEPDKQKLNIFKKISKSRDDKNVDLLDKIKNEIDVRENSSINPDVKNDKLQFYNNDIKEEKKSGNNHVNEDNCVDCVFNDRSYSPEVYAFDDMSPPGTPSTPKTPELNVPGVALEQKKKRKDKNSTKNDNHKNYNHRENSQKTKQSNDFDFEMLDRPKTPEALNTVIHKEQPMLPPNLPFPFFPPFPTAPGLIPHPISHPMFSRFPIPMPRGVQPPPMYQNFPFPHMPPPVKMEEPAVKQQKKMYNHIPPMPNSGAGVSGPSGPSGPSGVNLAGGGIHGADKVPPGLFNHELPKKEVEKKSKKHKVDKKEKLKKKKDKKDKHKEKANKLKEKKEKIEKVKEKKERKEKRKEKEKEDKDSEAVPKITLKLGVASPRPLTPENSLKKITIKPLVRKGDESSKRESSPELAKISALVTRPPKQKASKKNASESKKIDLRDDKELEKLIENPPVATIVDQSGIQVWICPACGNQDDGSPMIGCDDCDAWYHWVCVGMQVPPAVNEDWYCRLCIAKKQELHHDKKKKKRKKKVKINA